MLTLLEVLAAIAVGANRAEASDPSIEWRQIRTPHFMVIFDSRHHELAKLYAEFAEQAYATVAPSFGGITPPQTVLVINDSSDIANGFAMSLPYPMISAYPVLPSSLDAISDYGNWGLELLIHEYTHILTFEPATGWAKPLRYVFGGIVRPNMLLPRWYLEGIAVFQETRFSRHGRLRSANFLAIPRAMVEDDVLSKEDLGRINEVGIPDFPGGNRPYLIGALMWNEMVRLGGESVINDLNLAYSRRFPYFINGPLRSRLGIDYDELLEMVYERVTDNAKKQIALVQKVGETASEDFVRQGFINHSPMISPDGDKLAYIVRDHNVDSYVAWVKRPGPGKSFRDGQAKRVLDGENISRVSWLPDSTKFVYDSVGDFQRYNRHSDLWLAEIDAQGVAKKTQLTKGLRAREPVVSPDGQSIVFVQVVAGSTQLGMSDITGKNPQVLYSPGPQTRISRPEFLRPQQLIFSERGATGDETFVVGTLNVREGKWSLTIERQGVLREFSPVHYARQTKDGLLFVSDRSGVANLYLASADLQTARAVSNVTSRAVTGEIDPQTKELIFSLLYARGPQLVAVRESDWRAQATPPHVGSIVDREWPSFTPPPAPSVDAPESYNPLPYLRPRYWMPFVYFIPDGTYFQASTSAADPTGRHAYSLAVAYDSLSNKPSLFSEYVNHTTPVEISLVGEDLYEYLYGFNVARHTSAGLLAGEFYLPTLSNKWKGGVGWQYLQTDLDGDNLVRNGARVSVGYSDISQKGYEISPEKGGAFQLAHSRYLPTLGNLSYEQTDLATSVFFSHGLRERHAIAFFTRSTVAPNLDRTLLGRTTVGGNYQNAITQSSFVMRGYGSGVFIGRNMISTSLEYRFPLAYPYQGRGTTPLFVQRLHGDIFIDALAFDGIYYDGESKVYRSHKLGRPFYGVGAELKLDVTAFYQIPMQIIYGYYYGLDARANPHGIFPFIGLAI